MIDRDDDQPTQRLRIAPPSPPTAPLPGPLGLAAGSDAGGSDGRGSDADGGPAHTEPADAHTQPSDLGWPQDPDEPETGVLHLDEIFDQPAAPVAAAPPAPVAAEAPPAPVPAEAPPPPVPAAAPAAPVSAEAPTWTAMPVVPIRSDPAAAASTPGAAAHLANRSPRRRPQSELAGRVRADAVTAVRGAARETQAWLRVQDNAVMVMTALVGIMLIIVVALLGH